MDDEVEAEEAVDRLLDDGPAEVAVVLGLGEVRVVEDTGDVGAGRPERPERVVVDRRRRTQRAVERAEHHLVDVDDVADDVAGGPLLARRLVRPVIGRDVADQRLEAVGEVADAFGDLAHVDHRGTGDAQWVLYRSVIERVDDRRRAVEHGHQPARRHSGDVSAVTVEVGLVGVAGGGGEFGEPAAAGAAASRMKRCRRAIRVKNAGL